MELQPDGHINLSSEEARILIAPSPLPEGMVPTIVFAAEFRLEAIESKLQAVIPDDYREALLVEQKNLQRVAGALGAMVGEIMAKRAEEFLGGPEAGC